MGGERGIILANPILKFCCCGVLLCKVTKSLCFFRIKCKSSSCCVQQDVHKEREYGRIPTAGQLRNTRGCTKNYRKV